MDLMHNSTFRILKQPKRERRYEPGIYRVILDEPAIRKTAAVLIQPDDKERRGRGGRKKQETTRQKRKKAPLPLATRIVWMDRDELDCLEGLKLASEITVEREAIVRSLKLDDTGQKEFEKRVLVMAGFLDPANLRDSVLIHQGFGGLVRDATKIEQAKRPYVYKNLSNLCRYGFSIESLKPRRDRCGAPGQVRRCDPGGRKKPGRKVLKTGIANAYGVEYESAQPGMSTEWAAAINAADKAIPSPKPDWADRCTRIVNSAFVSKAKEAADGTIHLVPPRIGTYPNNAQIRRVLSEGKSRLERILERTTKAHFTGSLRGLIARNWQDVAGPGHSWAIDSTVGDIYVRSTVDRSWIVGRPIVYIIVDIWSTAIVGFHVCLEGPSWSTASVSLFNAAADPALIGDLWGYEPIMTLHPRPTMCQWLQCDRGEYLSQAHRVTALKLIPHTSYTPPYRGDLKGLVEVLHRIEKDKQFQFIPGAMDYRRAELELRRVNPEDCVMNVREYVQYLHDLFAEYNLTADRSHRVDAHMLAAGVFPSPAGLWRWGHEMGIGLRRLIEDADLITGLLPSSEARVRRDAVRWAKCDYMSDDVKAAQWTAIARNYRGWNVPIHHYPGSLSRIWTPNVGGTGLLQLNLSEQSKGSPELTYEDYLDSLAIETMRRADVEHLRTTTAVEFLNRRQAQLDAACRATTEALAAAAGKKAPSMTEARAFEIAAGTSAKTNEVPSPAPAPDEARDAHRAMLAALLAAVNEEDQHVEG